MKRSEVVVFVAIVLFCSCFSFCTKKNGIEGNQFTNVFEVRRLSTSQRINLADRSLSEWGNFNLVLHVPFQRANHLQILSIQGKAPQPLNNQDIEWKVYMARDNNYWYIASEVMDDKILGVPSYYSKPYSGDCLELFFAGKELNGIYGYSAYVASPSSPNQAAFFQLDLPAFPLQESINYLPDFRTDSRFIQGAMDNGFLAQIWNDGSIWFAEARIPLAAFQGDVQSDINGGRDLKMNLDLLDYDRQIDRVPTAPPKFGFSPDNIFCLDNQMNCLDVPKYMRIVCFK